MAEPGPPATERGAERRRAIVAAAAELFARHGYPAVGMDDIGAAAGVTGPAIYRHFDSKAAVLASVIDGIIDAVDAPEGGDGTAGLGGDGRPQAARVRPSADGATPTGGGETAGLGGDGRPQAARVRPSADGATPTGGEDGSSAAADRLARLIGRYAAAVAERRELMAVFVREVHHLPVEHAERLRHRQRDLVARWRTLLAAAHPGWPAERVRTGVHAVFGMLNAVGTFSSPLPDDVLAGQLTGLGLSALELPSAEPATRSSRA